MTNPNPERDNLHLSDGIRITAFIIGLFVLAIVIVPTVGVLAFTVAKAIAEWMGI